MDSPSIGDLFLESVRFRFEALKKLGDGAFAQVGAEDLAWALDAESNSIAVNVKHLHGNMMSRWTDFLTTDGEKDRDRDGEFEAATIEKAEILKQWEEGWRVLLDSLNSLRPEDLMKNVTIRGQELNVIDAIHRQLAHYAYHVGQIVLIAKYRAGARWQSLSIPRGQSTQYRPAKRD